mmetsp:Transcript_4140/g.8971  ORF Transcript_4140/g.8971 Transcript_4140/m.8971 type:complete len:1085 (-) Transcript_4140:482-3736(-)
MDLAEDTINLEPKGAAGWNHLHLAAATGNFKALLNLLNVVAEQKNEPSDDRTRRRPFLGAEDRSVSFKKESLLESRTSSGDRAFHVALRNGQALAARELARAGADIKSRGKDGESAAHICAYMDMAEELTWMIRSHHLDPTTTTDRGETVIHCASRECRISFLEWAIREPFCTPEFFVQADKQNQSCLHYAARNGIRTGVQWVLDHLDSLEKDNPEFDVLVALPVNNQGKDPCALARSEGHYMCAELIDEYRKTKIRDRKFRKQTLKRMLDAARRDNLKSVQHLTKKHSRYFDILTARNARSGNCAAFEAAATGSVEVVRWILERSSRDGHSYVDEKHIRTGETLLHKAALSGSDDLVRLLIERGFDVDAKNAKGETVLQVTPSHYTKVVDLLKAEEERIANKAAAEAAAEAAEAEAAAAAAAAEIQAPARSSSIASQEAGEGRATSPAINGVRRSKSASTTTSMQSRLEEKLSQLKEWLVELDMENWLDKMCEEGFDSLERAQLINEDDLADWGMKKGYRRSFLRALESLRIDDHEPDAADLASEPSSPAGAAIGSARRGNSGGHNKPYTERPHVFDDMLNDLQEGDEVTIDAFTAGNKYSQGQPRRYILRRSGHVYECTCPEWKLNKEPREARTCEHLKEFRGEQAELRRIDLQRTRAYNMQSLHDEFRERIRKKRQENSRVSSSSTSSSSTGSSFSSTSADMSRSTAMRSQSERNMLASQSRESSFQDSVGVPSHQILAYEELTFGQIIGEGSFGVVRAAEWRGMLVAVKELRGNEKLLLAGSNPAGVEVDETLMVGPKNPEGPPGLTRCVSSSSSEEWDLKHEAAMMSRVSNHENIVPFVGVLLTPRPCVVTKLMRGGSVEDMLVVPGPLYKRKTMPEVRILQMLVDAAAGVLHLHSEGVIHRDIASRNLLVDENLRVKVADFGFARIKEINRSKGYTSQHVGPIKWMAPEAMRYRRFSEQTDVFSFGVTLFEVLVGKKPWEGIESMDVVYRICDGERQLVPAEIECQQALRDLVEHCQRHGPEDRPVMKEVHKALSNTLHTSQAAMARPSPPPTSPSPPPVSTPAPSNNAGRAYAPFRR